MEAAVFYFLMLQKYINPKQKILKEKKNPLRLGNISGNFLANNMRKNRIKWMCMQFFCLL